jgi:hypothetical protein
MEENFKMEVRITYLLSRNFAVKDSFSANKMDVLHLIPESSLNPAFYRENCSLTAYTAHTPIQ